MQLVPSHLKEPVSSPVRTVITKLAKEKPLKEQVPLLVLVHSTVQVSS